MINVRSQLILKILYAEKVNEHVFYINEKKVYNTNIVERGIEFLYFFEIRFLTKILHFIYSSVNIYSLFILRIVRPIKYKYIEEKVKIIKSTTTPILYKKTLPNLLA